MLVARYWLGYVVAVWPATVQRWLDSLSEELTTRDAALALVRAWIYALSGQREESEVFLHIIEGIQYQGPLPDGTASVESGVAIIRSAFGYDGVQAAVEAAQRAAELESKQLSPRTALMRFALGFSLYCSGETSQAHQPLEEALRLTSVEQPLLQIVILSALSFVVADEGHLERAEAFAREAEALVDRFGLRHVPQASAAPIALGKVLAKRGNLAAAQSELESALSVRRKLPGLNAWATLVGLLALAQVLGVRGDRAGAREVLDEARATMEPFGEDSGIFPELLEREERKLRRHKRGRVNSRGSSQSASSTFFASSSASHLPGRWRRASSSPEHGKDPGQIYLPQARGLLARCSCSGGSLQGTHLVLPTNGLYPLGEMCRWGKTNHPAVHYAQRQRTLWRARARGAATMSVQGNEQAKPQSDTRTGPQAGSQTAPAEHNGSQPSQGMVWVRIAPSQVMRTVAIAILTAAVVLGALFLI